MIRSLNNLNGWVFKTPEWSLEQAYDAVLMIKAIEDEYFEGQKVERGEKPYSDLLFSCFETELNANLNTAQIRLREFQQSRSALSLNSQRPFSFDFPELLGRSYSKKVEDYNVLLEKLQFIDDVLLRYNVLIPETEAVFPNNTSLIPLDPDPKPAKSYGQNRPKREEVFYPQPPDRSDSADSLADSVTSTMRFVPRSILGTIDRLRRELDPRAEEEVVKTFRSSKNKTVISLKFILLLILVPLLVHQLSKSFLVGPFVDRFQEEHSTGIFLNIDMEEEGLAELERFENKLDFRVLIHAIPPLSAEEKEAKIQEKAEEIAEDYRERGANAVKNVFADLCSVIAFTLVLFRSKQDLKILKSFIDEIVYGLSDSAKAFIIILFTDIFVGFHSPHGWEVILEGLCRHLGLPESRQFIFLFIATFPVILDTIFKYWIFRYLNRISPSAVATYRNMNE